MQFLPVIFFVVAGAVVVLCLLLIVRNHWVYKQQMFFLRETFDRPAMQWYELGCPGHNDVCEDYDTMMRRWWIWDREKFRKITLPPPLPEVQEPELRVVH